MRVHRDMRTQADGKKKVRADVKIHHDMESALPKE